MDYFYATLDEGSLVMEPFCGQCHQPLNEDYYCERCQRQCRCIEIVCPDRETLEAAQRFIEGHPDFQRFHASEGPRKGQGLK